MRSSRSATARWSSDATVRRSSRWARHATRAATRCLRAPRARRILFSTHAYLSPGDPRLSALVLDQVDRATGTDGYVTVAELPGYTLASDLVVLSACETGLGRIVRGEGIMGLPYALYLAGNADAIVSLWPVLDGSTAEFMRRLFAHLRQGASHADALAAVKRESLRDPARRDPLTWAAFVLYGTR